VKDKPTPIPKRNPLLTTAEVLALAKERVGEYPEGVPRDRILEQIKRLEGKK
jgi:hypothetical protein